MHGQWKATGFDKQSHVFTDFKLKRNEYRSGLRQFILCKENNKIKSLCEASEVNEKLFWKMLKSNKAKCKTTCFLVNGEYINSEPDVLDMWTNHFEFLGQPTVEASFDEPFRLKVESAVQEIFIDCLNTLSCTNSIFIFDAVQEACQGLQCGVAGGPDMTSYEHLKYGGPILWNILSKLYFKLFFAHDIPSQFKRQLVLPLFKGKGAKAFLKDNYRGIAMFSVFCKVFEMTLLRHLETIAEGKGYFSHLQFGFKEGVSCLEASYVISETINHLTERGGKVFACFLDVRKAFDTVWINGLLYKLKHELNIDPKIWLVIRELYKDVEGQVIFNGGISRSFSIISQGSGQGRILSPFLYKVYINRLLVELNNINIGISLLNHSLSSPCFADDLTLVSCYPTCLKILIQIAYEYSCKWRYQFNYDRKTAVVVFGETPVSHSVKMKARQWNVGPNSIYELSEYVNLGVFKNYCGSFDKTLMKISPRQGKRQECCFLLILTEGEKTP